MAESGEEEMAASWWGGWLQTAKEKSFAALDMVRKDLTEFGTTMQSDAGHVVELTSSTLKDSLKTENTSAAKEKLTKGLNTVLERLSQALVVPPDDEGQIPITATSAELYDRTKARIHAIQSDPGTYLNEPSGAEETYSMWCEGFELDDQKGDISELLVSKAEVRALYTKLVPSRVSHVDFWRHYFYKLHQLEVEQARKEALMKRADSVGAEDSISWEDDWSGDEAAAEDSGSDWEKLPRPSHHYRRSRSPSRSPSLSPARSPTTPAILPLAASTSSSTTPQKATKDCHNVSSSVVEMSQGEGELASAMETLLEGKQQEDRGQSLVSEQAAVPQQLSVGVASTAVLTAVPAVGSPAEDAASSPPRRSADSFKDYLQLSAGSVPTVADPAREPVSASQQPVQAETQHLGVEEKSPSCEGESPLLDLTPASPLLPTHLVSSPVDASLPEEAEGEQPAAPTPADDDVPLASLVEEVAGKEKVDVKEVLSVRVEEEEEGSLKTRERGDLVVVGSDHGSPLSNTSGSKVPGPDAWYILGLSDMEDDWEQDLDIELTEEDMKEAEDLAKKLGDNINLEEDDWESWE